MNRKPLYHIELKNIGWKILSFIKHTANLFGEAVIYSVVIFVLSVIVLIILSLL